MELYINMIESQSDFKNQTIQSIKLKLVKLLELN